MIGPGRPVAKNQVVRRSRHADRCVIGRRCNAISDFSERAVSGRVASWQAGYGGLNWVQAFSDEGPIGTACSCGSRAWRYWADDGLGVGDGRETRQH